MIAICFANSLSNGHLSLGALFVRSDDEKQTD